MWSYIWALYTSIYTKPRYRPTWPTLPLVQRAPAAPNNMGYPQAHPTWQQARRAELIQRREELERARIHHEDRVRALVQIEETIASEMRVSGYGNAWVIPPIVPQFQPQMGPRITMLPEKYNKEYIQ